MKIEDDRTDEQRSTHRRLVVGTDRFLSGWGEAKGGVSIAAWACRDASDEFECYRWVSRRGEMSRVRVVVDQPGRRYHPRGPGHLHVYVWDPDRH